MGTAAAVPPRSAAFSPPGCLPRRSCAADSPPRSRSPRSRGSLFPVGRNRAACFAGGWFRFPGRLCRAGPRRQGQSAWNRRPNLEPGPDSVCATNSGNGLARRTPADYKSQRKNQKMDYDAEMATGEVQVEATATPVPAPVAPAPKLRPHWSMNIIGIAGILALCYFGESVLAVMMVSVLLAFILAPIVDLLTYLRLPRSLAAAIAILLLLGALGGVVFYSYNQAATLLQDLHKYTNRVREEALRFRKSA